MAAAKRGYCARWKLMRRTRSWPLLLEWKSQEMLRIAYREVSCCRFSRTTQDILGWQSAVAIRFIDSRSTSNKKWGSPKRDSRGSAMGKLGGKGLNSSSEIDVIFLYHERGLLIHGSLSCIL